MGPAVCVVVWVMLVFERGCPQDLYTNIHEEMPYMYEKIPSKMSCHTVVKYAQKGNALGPALRSN